MEWRVTTGFGGKIKMKRCALLFVAILVITGVAGAAPCAGLPPTGPALMIFNNQPSPATSSTTFSCGGLTFSGFAAQDATNTPNITLALTNADVTGGGTVNLTFNPNLSNNQDIYFYFNVSGPPLGAVDLAVGGAGATIVETGCTAPIMITRGNTCGATSLFTFAGTSGSSQVVSVAGAGATTYIFKDIGTTPQGAITSFTQSFTPIPEPMSFVLLGSGLLGLGLAHRRRRKA
jgi:hypothetical protein